ncbi:hypothetical protein [Nostoc sp. C110]
MEAGKGAGEQAREISLRTSAPLLTTMQSCLGGLLEQNKANKSRKLSL